MRDKLTTGGRYEGCVTHPAWQEAAIYRQNMVLRLLDF